MSERKRILKTAGNVFLVVAVLVIAFSAWQLFRIFFNYKVSEDEYDDARRHAAFTDDRGKPFDTSWGYTPGKPLRIDFEKLQSINPDIVAWIYVPGLDISYPVMHANDNDKYLHTTYRGTYAYAGSIFMDCDNDPEFFDRHTIIYGHNMNNGTMFGRLRRCIDLADPPFNPYIWIMTPDSNLCYRMFSSRIVDEDSDDYLMFKKEDDDGVAAWEKAMRSKSMVRYEDYPFRKKDRDITLSTCHADHTHRRVIHAILIHEEEPER